MIESVKALGRLISIITAAIFYVTLWFATIKTIKSRWKEENVFFLLTSINIAIHAAAIIGVIVVFFTWCWM